MTVYSLQSLVYSLQCSECNMQYVKPSGSRTLLWEDDQYGFTAGFTGLDLLPISWTLRTSAHPTAVQDPLGDTGHPPVLFHLPLTIYHQPLATYDSSLTTYHSSLTTYHLPLTTYHLPPSTIHLPITTHHLPPTTYHLPLTRLAWYCGVGSPRQSFKPFVNYFSGHPTTNKSLFNRLALGSIYYVKYVVSSSVKLCVVSPCMYSVCILLPDVWIREEWLKPPR